MVFLGLSTLYLFSTPKFANSLLAELERYPALPQSEVAGLASKLAARPAAVVVLGGGNYGHAPQYGGPVIDESAATRLLYASWLSVQLDQPLMVTGGSLGLTERSHAAQMADFMERHLSATPRWIEDQSRTTHENAKNAAVILDAERIADVVLVTHAYHMPRAVRLFETSGFEVHAAPIATALAADQLGPLAWLPNAAALRDSRASLHEILGLCWYRVTGVI